MKEKKVLGELQIVGKVDSREKNFFTKIEKKAT